MMPPASRKAPAVDLAIVGGGPAGMSAALVVGRARLKAVVINEEAPRNAVTVASHGFLTRDGAHPSELLAVAKGQLNKYETVRYLKRRVTGLRRDPSGFTVEVAGDAPVTATRIIDASGRRDDLTQLGLPGVEEVYGKSVFPCPFCDGFEHRDLRLAVFGGPGVEHYTRVVSIWSSDIVVFTNGSALGEEASEMLRRNDVRVVADPVARLVSSAGILGAVELSTGTRIEREAGFIAEDASAPANDFAEALGAKRARNELGLDVLDVDPLGRSSVPGLYVVGDSRSGFGGIAAAAAEGSACAEGIVHELAGERWAVGTAPTEPGPTGRR